MRHIMLKTAILLAASSLIGGSPAIAHDVGAEYASRGACESALAQINTEDRKFLLSIGEFQTEGEANRWFHEVFRCEQQGDKWVLVFDPEA